MNALSFLNQPLLWGLGLASIPIIIHLLFRRRFRQIGLGADQISETVAQRIGAVSGSNNCCCSCCAPRSFCCCSLPSRPVMHAAGLGSWLAGRSRTNQLLLVDDSLSMGFRQRGRSAFERAQELAAEVIRTIGPQDRLTIVLSSRPRCAPAPRGRSDRLRGVDEPNQGMASLRHPHVLASDAGCDRRIGQSGDVSDSRGDVDHRPAAPAGTRKNLPKPASKAVTRICASSMSASIGRRTWRCSALAPVERVALAGRRVFGKRPSRTAVRGRSRGSKQLCRLMANRV